MANVKREKFVRERRKVLDLDDPDVAGALGDFADALDPQIEHELAPKPGDNGRIEHQSYSHETGYNYLKALRLVYQRGLELLDVDAETVNDFMDDIVTEPRDRRYDLVEYNGSLKKTTAKQYQAAVRLFFRYCTEPGKVDDRPDAHVEWPAEDIFIFTDQSDPRHDEEDMPTQSDLDALREACIDFSNNTRRDRAFLELAAGTGQRVYALVTLKVKHVTPYGDDGLPHILLNPEIKNDGDKGAIENTGRWKPIVTDPGPVAKWIENHPLRDREAREKHGAPEEFGECYLFIGDIQASRTDPSSHWHESGPRDMLDRRKANTGDIPNVKTVTIPVNPHNWRHYAYTKSKDLPIDEGIRRKVFGWSPGSTTGETVYGHQANKTAGEKFAEAWAEEFGDEQPSATGGVAEEVAGSVFGGDLSPETRKALARDLVNDESFMAAITQAMEEATS